jgi:cGMP-dependent protein kinase
VLWVITSKTFNDVMPANSIEYLRGRMGLQDAEYTFADLQFVRVIGTGGFGVVKMVQTKSGERYALKSVRKQPVVEFQQQESLINERSVLAGIDHPFIVRLVQSFHTDYFVYFLQELVSGGELLEALTKLNFLNLEQSQFYTASITLAFEHLHERRIAYLDLKSENVLLDGQGYIKIVDFGLAVKISGGQAHAVKGTPHFMAPEMILSKGYDTTADLWALGVCVYEFMFGVLPFGNDSTVKAEIFKQVLKAPLKFSDEFKQKPYAEQSISLITGLLQRNPGKRLGAGLEGYTSLFDHAFFEGVDWDGLIARKVPPPYVPNRERYNEELENLRKSMFGRSLAVVEKEAEDEERKKGWEDPDPGWDDDFC